MRIIIYGFTPITEFIEQVLRKEHEIIGYSDSSAQLDYYNNRKFYNAEELHGINVDYIILAVRKPDSCMAIQKKLTETGIDKDKIINFMEIFTEPKVDKIMRSSREKPEGIILGMSYALFGIRSELLSGNWYNLAVTSEDMYYHLKCLECCVDKHEERLSDLKYVLVDLWEPCILNWDVSLSQRAVSYYANGGIVADEHHFADNLNFSGDLEMELRKANCYYAKRTNRDLNIREELFQCEQVFRNIGEKLLMDEPAFVLGYNDCPYNRQYKNTQFSFPQDLYFSFFDKRYTHTVEENKSVIIQLLQLIKQINNNMNIIFLLMPKYGSVERIHRNSPIIFKWKTELENFIDMCKRDYSIKYLDFCGKTPSISENRCFWSDPVHMSYYGSLAFTSILNKTLKDETIL